MDEDHPKIMSSESMLCYFEICLLLKGFNELIHEKWIEYCVAHNTHSIKLVIVISLINTYLKGFVLTAASI